MQQGHSDATRLVMEIAHPNEVCALIGEVAANGDIRRR
jgi:hypothetical protein